MEKLLYLVHRIPYPPNKGDKIRSFHWLKGLSKKYKIYLGTFIDDPEDEKHIEELDQYCEEVHIVRLNPAVAKLKSLTAMLSGQALTLPYYYDSGLNSWIEQVVKQYHIEKTLVFSSSMAQYVEGAQFSDMMRVIDFVDVDSDKWRQYAERKAWPASYIFHREAQKLLEYEKKIAKDFDASVFVSEAESLSFAQMLGDTDVKVTYVNNGVDADYFSPDREYENPYSAGIKPIVFTGAMDYWANVDAVRWFAREVFPTVKSRCPDSKFFIVGSRPSEEVLELQKHDGIVVTGRVEDIRPYVAHASLSVAPMRIARGIQNKVLEAMAMGKLTLVSPEALEGISARSGKQLLLIENEAGWCTLLPDLLNKTEPEIGQAARRFVLDHYSWESNLSALDDCFETN